MTHRAGHVLAASLTMALVLGGCASAPTEYDAGAAERLQAKVVAVTASSAATDYASAMVALDELVAQAKDALARHQISSPRYESIMAAVRLVQADLEAAIASLQPAPAQAPADGGDQGTGQQGSGGTPGTDTGNSSDGADTGNTDTGNTDTGKGDTGKGDTGKKDEHPAKPKPKDK